MLIALAALAVAACNGGADAGCEWKGHHHELGEVFPDDCNTCTCTAQGAGCSLVGCGPQIDGNPAACEPSPSDPCPHGVSCDGYCCGKGEHCVNDVCMCGTGAACGSGDQCSGPVMASGCGSTCCGASRACPL